MEKIIIDTNVFLELAKGLDIIEELKRVCSFTFELYVTEGIIKELEKISERSKNGREGNAARIALKYITGKFKVLKDKLGYVDDELAMLSDKGYIVATMDRGLKNRLRRKIILRQGKRFIIEGISVD